MAKISRIFHSTNFSLRNRSYLTVFNFKFHLRAALLLQFNTKPIISQLYALRQKVDRFGMQAYTMRSMDEIGATRTHFLCETHGIVDKLV